VEQVGSSGQKGQREKKCLKTIVDALEKAPQPYSKKAEKNARMTG
jgi:hypothetical protein